MRCAQGSRQQLYSRSIVSLTNVSLTNTQNGTIGEESRPNEAKRSHVPLVTREVFPGFWQEATNEQCPDRQQQDS